jgi:hypothetical protein
MNQPQRPRSRKIFRIRKIHRRRGMGTVEWILVAAAVILVCVVAVGLVGGVVTRDLDDTAVEVADPAQLPQRFSGN